VVLFACVLALESADLATIGAAGPELRGGLGISNTELGLLAAVSTFVGAIATVPLGVLVDRIRRVDLLAAAVALWGVAMAACAGAQGYDWLLLSRLGLGAVTAAAGPAIASLTGDFFAPAERAKIYGYILSGELLGAGFGFVVSGSVAGALSWRWAFGVLAVPAAFLALAIWRGLPEPARGGQSQLLPGSERIVDENDVTGGEGNGRPHLSGRHRERDEIARRAVGQRNLKPIRRNILRQDPGRMAIIHAVRYVLRVKTNRWLIVASAIGYFFFAGLRTFAVVFVRGHFGLGQTEATVILFLAGLGSLAGVLLAGRLADRLIEQGKLDARVIVPAISYLVAPLLLLPALLVGAIAVAGPLLVLAAAALSAPNPPLDAARLDVMPAGLWGRAEGVRTLLRQSAQAAAPLLFGVLADALGSGGAALGSSQHVSTATAAGLEYTFLIMLVPLALNGLALLKARTSYPADVATALASERRARSRKHARIASRKVTFAA
jgi:MFS family permease